MPIIKSLKACQIYNSSGFPAVEVTLILSDGKNFTASVPQGLSRGRGEAACLSTSAAISQIKNRISPIITKNMPNSQEEIDAFLLSQNVAANASLPVSIAFAKAYNTFPVPKHPDTLPKLMLLLFEGGAHGSPSIKIQEFMVIVNRFETGKRLFDRTKKYLSSHHFPTTTGSEGALSPPLNDLKIMKILDLLLEKKHHLALDIAGNHANLSARQLKQMLCSHPQISSLEDPFPETSLSEWEKFYSHWRRDKQIVADDLTVSDKEKITAGAGRYFNAVIIKPNQQHTLTQAKLALLNAKKLKLKTIVSHRGSDTNDDFIIDFGLSCHTDYFKLGAPNRGERIAKYNRLLYLTRHCHTR